jgi:uncharacterized repeat protein (TIGR01451 family)
MLGLARAGLPAQDIILRIDVGEPAGTVVSETASLTTWRTEGPARGSVPVKADVSLVLDLPPGSITEGWSFSLRTAPCFNVSSATTAGTVAANPPVGLYQDGFRKTEVVDPAKNGGQEGIVTAVALSLGGLVSLPPVSRNRVLRVSGEIDLAGVPEGETTSPCRLAIVPSGGTGLAGSGVPVATTCTVDSFDAGVDAVVDLDLLVEAVPPPFRRGDANGDGRAYLDDVAWILNDLLRGGPSSTCDDAADADDDGALGPADAVALVGWVLLGAAGPPAPGPAACGMDPTSDGLECIDYAPGCAAPGSRPATPAVELELVGPPDVVPGTLFDVEAHMTSSVAVQGFSLGLEASGASIVDLVAAGAAAQADSIHREILTGSDGRRAIIAVDLDRDGIGAASIPPGADLHIFTLRLQAPEDLCSEVSIRFAGGTRGNGQPIENLVTVAGEGKLPVLGSLAIPMRSEALAVDMPFDANIDGCRLFRIDPPFSGALLLELEDADPLDENAVYFRWGEPPSPAVFDRAARSRDVAVERLVVEGPSAEPAYILVQSNPAGGGASDITIRAEEVEIAFEAISASSSGKGGTGLLHLGVTGGGFQPGTRFSLEPAGGGEGVEASEVFHVSSARADLVFDLSGLEPGPHDAVAEVPGGESARLEGAFTVLPTSIGPLLEVSLLGDRQGERKFRYDRPSRLTLRYRNAGDVEMPAPLLQVTAPPGTSFHLARDEALQEGRIQVLAIQPDGYPGWLPPGGGWEVPIFFRSTACRDCIVDFRVFTLTPLPDEYIGWDALAAPEGMTPAEWSGAWPGLSASLGGSWEEYRAGLAEVSRRLAHRGGDATSVRAIFRRAALEARGGPASAITGRVRLASGGNAVAGAAVVALDGGMAASSASTDADGSFALDCLHGGRTYTIRLADFRVVSTSLGTAEVAVPRGGDVIGVEVAVLPGQGVVPAAPPCDETGLPDRPLDPPAELFALVAQWDARLVSSWDPNDKEGPEGESRGADVRLIPPDEPIEYTIHFENRPQASAAAQEVVVTDFLPDALDAGSVRLLGFQIPGLTLAFDVEGRDLASGYTRDLAVSGFETSRRLEVVPAEPESPVIDVAFEATVEPAEPRGRPLRWRFTTLADDPFTGFLQPNCTPGCDCASLPVSGPDEAGCKDGRGEGSVTFTVMPVRGLPEGTIIENRAEVSFDGLPHEGDPLVWLNEISYFLPPEEPGAPEPPSGARIDGTQVELAWADTPGAVYDVYVWVAGSPPELVAMDLTEPMFTVEDLLPGTRYSWQVVAKDAEGETASPEWVFGTAETLSCPPLPSSSVPAEGAVEVPEDTAFSWTVSPAPAEGSVAHDLFLWKAGEPEPARAQVRGLLRSRFDAGFALDAGTVYHWKVAVSHSGCTTEGPVRTFTTRREFRRGRVNDDPEENLTDAIFILNFLFVGTAEPPCRKSADLDDNGTVDLTDAIRLLNYLFIGGPAPDEPHAECGVDTTEDDLACEEFTACQ